MNCGNISNHYFKTIYVSKELSNCPLISEVINIGKKLFELDFSKNISKIIFSLRYGKRILINTDISNFGEMNREDFLEIVDYNPLKRIFLTIGTKEPLVETPVHWLIYHARDEINAIIQINDDNSVLKFKKKMPITKKAYTIKTLEQAKEILKNLRNNNRVVIKNQGAIFVGNSIKEVEEIVLKTYEEFK